MGSGTLHPWKVPTHTFSIELGAFLSVTPHPCKDNRTNKEKTGILFWFRGHT